MKLAKYAANFPGQQTRIARQAMRHVRPPDGLAQEMALELG
jgi:hypothetical protein